MAQKITIKATDGSTIEFIEYQLGEIRRFVAHGKLLLGRNGSVASLVDYSNGISHLGTIGLGGNRGRIGIALAGHGQAT